MAHCAGGASGARGACGQVAGGTSGTCGAGGSSSPLGGLPDPSATSRASRSASLIKGTIILGMKSSMVMSLGT